MKRLMRFFIAIIVCWGFILSAYAQDYEKGKHYQEAPKEVGENPLIQDLFKQGNGKVQVLEFFSYGCHWCYKLDPYLDRWQKNMPSYVAFQRIPVEFHPAWATLTKAYYTEVSLNALDKIHTALFDAIQTDRISNSSEATLRQFFSSHGINEQKFTEVFNSFNVTKQQKWANAISQAYRVTAVPAVIVQGPKGIFITSVRLAGSEDNMIKVIDYLTKKQHEALIIVPKNNQKTSVPVN